MIFLAHRGLWKEGLKPNSLDAFGKALESGFGIETDIRDSLGGLVISHDLADSGSIAFKELLALYKQLGKDLPLAINIKADGLRPLLKRLLDEFKLTNYFVFDMSVPDARHYFKGGFRTFTRESEFEKIPSFYEEACGVWLDELNQRWINFETIKKHLSFGKEVCIVSPELHGRAFKEAWGDYKQLLKDHDSDKLMLCTDYPKEAKEFFYA